MVIVPKNKKSLYVASNLGFTESGRDFLYSKVIPAVEKIGFFVLDPWKLTPQELVKDAQDIKDERQRVIRLREVNRIIGRNNEDAIRMSNGMLAILDGQEIDSGVASEVGFGYGLGKRIIGYRNDFRLSGENYGTSINLQVEYFVRESKGVFISEISELERELSEFYKMLKTN